MIRLAFLSATLALRVKVESNDFHSKVDVWNNLTKQNKNESNLQPLNRQERSNDGFKSNINLWENLTKQNTSTNESVNVKPVVVKPVVETTYADNKETTDADNEETTSADNETTSSDQLNSPLNLEDELREKLKKKNLLSPTHWEAGQKGRGHLTKHADPEGFNRQRERMVLAQRDRMELAEQRDRMEKERARMMKYA